MTHSHAHHEHGHAVTNARPLWWALWLLVAFMAVEVVLGIVANSLALLSDAAHMLTDAAAIALALFAVRLAQRPAHGNFTFGYRRVEILAAQANGITLVLLAGWFVYEAIRRLISPPAVEGGLVLAVAVVGIAVNLVVVWLVGQANRDSMNVEGAFQHVLTDLFAFIATAVAGLVVLLFDWQQADAVATLIVAALMLRAGVDLVSASWRVFLEAAPEGIDVASIDADLHAMEGVVDVHDLHVWEVTSGFPALSAHITVTVNHDCHDLQRQVVHLLTERYGIDHTTLQVEHPPAAQVFTPESLQRAPSSDEPR